MSEAKAKPAKDQNMNEGLEFKRYFGAIFPDARIAEAMDEIQRRADVLVARNKKEMSKEEREAFRDACLQKAFWGYIKPYMAEATNYPIFSWPWLARTAAKGGVYITMAGAVIWGASAISRVSSSSSETTGTGDATVDNPFRTASARPGRRGHSAEAAV